MRLIKRLKHATLYYLVRIVWFLFNRIQRDTAIWLGGTIGALAWRLIKRDQTMSPVI
mgnify:CR=1 FL=1